MILTNDRDRLARHMLEALMAGNAHRASAVATESFDCGLDLLELFDDVVAPALRVVGERWQEGLVRYTQERFATTAAEALLDRLAPSPVADDAPEWLVTTAAGDEHRIGVRMAAATLGHAGMRVHTAFCQPEAEIVSAAAGASGVCIACTGPWSVVAARSAAMRVAASGTPVLLGGSGWAGWQDPPAISLIGSMAELAASAERQRSVA